MKIVVFLRAVTFEILHEISPFALFFWSKKYIKTTMYPAKKPLRFVKNFVFLRPVTSELLHEISPFALFLVKKQVRKHAVPSKKTVNFYVTFLLSDGCSPPPSPSTALENAFLASFGLCWKLGKGVTGR